MTTLAKHMVVAGVENRPLIIDKTMYNSWQSRVLLYIKGKKNGRMMLESIENEPLVYPTIEENGAIRQKKYVKLTEQEKLLTGGKGIWPWKCTQLTQAKEFLHDGKLIQTTILRCAFRTDDLDAYDSDCDDISSAKAVLMANLSSYGLDVLSEVPHYDIYQNDMANQSVHDVDRNNA
ncbi:hypothetical protein Tco_0797993 [Tanacetum coccineum]